MNIKSSISHTFFHHPFFYLSSSSVHATQRLLRGVLGVVDSRLNADGGQRKAPQEREGPGTDLRGVAHLLLGHGHGEGRKGGVGEEEEEEREEEGRRGRKRERGSEVKEDSRGDLEIER